MGGWVAARLAASRPVTQALIVGAVTMVGGLMMLFTVTGPVWMWLEVPLYLVLPWMVGKRVEATRAAKAA